MFPRSFQARHVLACVAALVAFGAMPGGLMLLTGYQAPPDASLRGSMFSSFVIPGLVLLFGVGGSALVASRMLWRGHARAAAASVAAGAILVAFEIVEVLTIGSPAGPARVMQVGAVAAGGVLVLGALAIPSSSRTT